MSLSTVINNSEKIEKGQMVSFWNGEEDLKAIEVKVLFVGANGMFALITNTNFKPDSHEIDTEAEEYSYSVWTKNLFTIASNEQIDENLIEEVKEQQTEDKEEWDKEFDDLNEIIN